jgi:hypothetical protein
MAKAAEIQQFVSLWSLVMQVQRSNEPDRFTWRFTTSGMYIYFELSIPGTVQWLLC